MEGIKMEEKKLNYRMAQLLLKQSVLIIKARKEQLYQIHIRFHTSLLIILK